MDLEDRADLSYVHESGVRTRSIDFSKSSIKVNVTVGHGSIDFFRT